MGSKRPPPLDDPPSASSDEDDETEDEQETVVDKTTQQSSESEEESEESESEEQAPLRVIKPQIQNPNPKSESEEEEEEESEEEESEGETQTQTPTPISSSIFEFKPDIKSPSVSNFAIKPSKKITTPEKKPALKPPPDLNNKKKAKVSNADENKSSSSIIKRVWSEEDELMLLQGFIDYQSKNGCSPLSDMDGFYQFTMDSLPGNASKSQLYEKVRRLKKKFRVNQEKVTATGQDPVFVKPHERTLFVVSKKIWGINGCETVGNVNGSSVKPKARSIKPKPKPKPKVNVKVEKVEEVVDEEMMLVQVKDFETLYPYWNAGLNLLGASSSLNFPTGIVGLFRENLRLIEEAKAAEMNEKWKEHFENEAVLQKRKKELLSKVTSQ